MALSSTSRETGRRSATIGAVKPPIDCATTTTSSRPATASTTSAAYCGRPACGSSPGRSTATASWPACSSSGTTRCQYQAAPPAPGTSANVVTVHMVDLDVVRAPCQGDHMADDTTISDRITSLIDEEHRLRSS